MRPDRIILASTGIAILVGACLVYALRPKPIAPADAIKVLGLVGDPKQEPSTNLFRLSVAVTNGSARSFEVGYPTLQVRVGEQWINDAEALDPAANYATEIGPRGCATQTIAYVATMPRGDWRLRFFVSKKLTRLRKYLTRARRMMFKMQMLHPDPKGWGMPFEVTSPVFGLNAGTNRMAEIHR